MAEESADGPQKTVRGFRVVYVFDVTQTEGNPLPEIARPSGDPEVHTQRLRELVRAKGIELCYTDSLGSADGASAGGRIFLRRGLNAAEEFSTLVHELAHELLHSRKETRPSRTVLETEAEAVAFVVSKAIGLNVSSAAADYISLYKGNASTLEESLTRIQRTCAEILSQLLPSPELTPTMESENIDLAYESPRGAESFESELDIHR